jgi:hypothetical protein
MTYARRVDGNHNVIKEAFEKMGLSVADLSRLGDGVLDLLVAIPLMNVLVEVKVPGAGLRGKKQKDFYRDWKGPKAIVHTTDEAIALVAYMGEIARKLA